MGYLAYRTPIGTGWGDAFWAVEVAVSRTERRSGFQDEHRIRMLESDIDDLVDGIDKLRLDLTGEVEALRGTLTSIRTVLIGGLATFATSSVLLGLNLAIGN